MAPATDVVIVGAGAVGLACAAALSAAGRSVVVVERNERAGTETTSRNSEVVHAGLYYPEASLKARFCRDGREALRRDRPLLHLEPGHLLVQPRERDQAVRRLLRHRLRNTEDAVSALHEVRDRLPFPLHGRERIEHRANGTARRFGDKWRMLLQDRLQGGVGGGRL